ncbi:MAG: SPOR domain-containing protein [Prevotella sp.]|nr:SPOR domain-containing protein [Prevotella sp.]
MKKYVMICAAICASMAFTSCGSSKESAYRKAYEKAKAQEMAQQQQPATQQVQEPAQQNTPVVTPLVESPAQATVTDNNDNVPVRSENLTVVSGAGLKAYSVVVGSFGVRANAEGLQSTLTKAGYNAQVAYNSERNMYRVVATTFDSKANAVESRNSLRSAYPDAWLLMKQ